MAVRVDQSRKHDPAGCVDGMRVAGIDLGPYVRNGPAAHQHIDRAAVIQRPATSYEERVSHGLFVQC